MRPSTCCRFRNWIWGEDRALTNTSTQNSFRRQRKHGWGVIHKFCVFISPIRSNHLLIIPPTPTPLFTNNSSRTTGIWLQLNVIIIMHGPRKWIAVDHAKNVQFVRTFCLILLTTAWWMNWRWAPTDSLIMKVAGKGWGHSWKSRRRNCFWRWNSACARTKMPWSRANSLQGT
jgi:hypothetical protein